MVLLYFATNCDNGFAPLTSDPNQQLDSTKLCQNAKAFLLQERIKNMNLVRASARPGAMMTLGTRLYGLSQDRGFSGKMCCYI